MVRQEHNESQEELAVSVGVSRQSINSIENHRSTPGGKLMLAIARHYNMDAADIFFDDVVNLDEQKEVVR